jgi:hypothetical protein
MILRAIDALRWSRLAWFSLALGAAFGAGAIVAGNGGKSTPDRIPVIVASETSPPQVLAATRPGKVLGTRRSKRLAADGDGKRESVGLAAIETATPAVTPPQAASGGGRAQEQTLPAAGEVPRVAGEAELPAVAAAEPDAEPAQKAAKESRHPRRSAKRSRWRTDREFADGWAFDRPYRSERSFFAYDRF